MLLNLKISDRATTDFSDYGKLGMLDKGAFLEYAQRVRNPSQQPEEEGFFR